MTDWTRIGPSTIERAGYVICKGASINPEVSVYFCHAPTGAFVGSCGSETAEAAKEMCKQHERKWDVDLV